MRRARAFSQLPTEAGGAGASEDCPVCWEPMDSSTLVRLPSALARQAQARESVLGPSKLVDF